MHGKNKLYFGDNLRILREYVTDASVDLIYLDPPFNSSATCSFGVAPPFRAAHAGLKPGAISFAWRYSAVEAVKGSHTWRSAFCALTNPLDFHGDLA
jgi:site-specific DNA-methyltransferase (adenine-specific)